MFGIRASSVFDGDRFLPNGALVLIDEGRVVGVESQQAAAPDDAEVVHFADDATVLPGLINAHVHLCGDSGLDALERLPSFSPEELDRTIDSALKAQAAAGVTTVRDLGDHYWAVLARRDGAPSTGLPHIVASGPPITSVRGHCWMLGGEVSGSVQLQAAVRERAERGVDVVKVMASGGNMTPGTDVAATQFTDEELQMVVFESHRLGLPVTAHAHALTAVEQSIDAGVDGIEHCSCVTATGFEMSAELLDRLREKNVIVCPTMGKAIDVEPPPRVAEMMARTGMTVEARRQVFGRAHAAGVRVISGDDSGISPGKRHGVFAEAVVDLVLGGVSNEDALKTATSQAADSCGLGSRKGRLRSGLDADILVVRGDVARDITALRVVATVMIAGEVVAGGPL